MLVAGQANFWRELYVVALSRTTSVSRAVETTERRAGIQNGSVLSRCVQPPRVGCVRFVLISLHPDIESRVSHLLKEALTRVGEKYQSELEIVNEAIRQCETVIHQVAVSDAKAQRTQDIMVGLFCSKLAFSTEIVCLHPLCNVVSLCRRRCVPRKAARRGDAPELKDSWILEWSVNFLRYPRA